MRGYTGAEDFAFDAEGYMVSIDNLGNLVGIRQTGEQKVIMPEATLYGAGTGFLPERRHDRDARSARVTVVAQRRLAYIRGGDPDDRRGDGRRADRPA